MKLLLFMISCLLFEASMAQKKTDQFYVFDRNWKPIEIKKATYLLVVREVSATSFVHMAYNLYGPRISIEQFLDKEGTTLNGDCRYYYPSGRTDSTGEFVKSIPNGSWYFYNDSGMLVREKEYDLGKLIKDTLYEAKRPDSSGTNVKPGETESAFPGGPQGWMRFLNKNFSYPKTCTKFVDYRNGAPAIRHRYQWKSTQTGDQQIG